MGFGILETWVHSFDLSRRHLLKCQELLPSAEQTVGEREDQPLPLQNLPSCGVKS